MGLLRQQITLLYLVFYMMNLSTQQLLPMVINTWPWSNATFQAWKTLQSNGSLLDAVVAGCKVAEEDRSITSVGWGGSPAENGETALDAMIMDGKTHNIGAVGSMKRIKNAVQVARHVMENTKHTFLVGEDATRFAVRMGFTEEDLHSNESIAQWEKWKNGRCQPNYWTNVKPDPQTSCGPYTPSEIESESQEKREVRYNENNHDTIGLVVVGADGNIAAGTSTNGATFKITGRVGDSPIPGSGCYVDNDVGSAAATGDGDIMMRFLPSYQAVENMRRGMGPNEAAEEALRRIIKYYNKFEGALVAVNKQGVYGAACYGWTFQYSVINPELKEVKVITVTPIENV